MLILSQVIAVPVVAAPPTKKNWPLMADVLNKNCAQNPNNNCQGNGLQPNHPLPGLPFTFSIGPAAPGQGCIGGAVAPQNCLGGLIAYIVSPTEIVFMPTGTAGNPTPAEIFIAQQ